MIGRGSRRVLVVVVVALAMLGTMATGAWAAGPTAYVTNYNDNTVTPIDVATNTPGATSQLAGTIIASASITMGATVTIDGRALAVDGAVTMIGDTVHAAPCTPVVASTAPSITPFSAQLTGRNQTITTGLGAWSVTDARDSNAGYSVTVAASRPTVDGSTAAAGTGASLTLTPGTATADNYNPPSTAPVAASSQLLSATATTIEAAPAGTGQGQWEFAADSGAAASLAIMIPGDSAKGAYNSTLTFTTAPPAA